MARVGVQVCPLALYCSVLLCTVLVCIAVYFRVLLYYARDAPILRPLRLYNKDLMPVVWQ